MASRDKYRKYMSGNQKRPKKQKKDDFLNSQRGSLNKYIDSSSSLVVDININEDTVCTFFCIFNKIVYRYNLYIYIKIY